MDPYKQAAFSSESYTPDRLVVSTLNLRHEKVTIKQGEVRSRGAVLGQITVGGKYVLSAAAAGDGSETPTRVLAHDVDATDGDVEALVYYTGDFDENAVTLGAGHTVASIKEGLRDRGIFLHPSQTA